MKIMLNECFLILSLLKMIWIVFLLRCGRLSLTVLAYLWRRDQTELLAEMIDCHVEAIVIKVAALGRVRVFSLVL